MGYSFVADNISLSSFVLQLLVLKSAKFREFELKTAQGHRSWYQLIAHMQLSN